MNYNFNNTSFIFFFYYYLFFNYFCFCLTIFFKNKYIKKLGTDPKNNSPKKCKSIQLKWKDLNIDVRDIFSLVNNGKNVISAIDSSNDSISNINNIDIIEQSVIDKKLFRSDFEIHKGPELELSDFIDENAKRNFEIREKIDKKYDAKIWIKIICWNMQSLNKDQSKRQNKLEFMRDTLNENKADYVFLIDVNDNENRLLLNGFNKFYDGRNALFVKMNIYNEIITSRNCIIDAKAKLAFVYVTPASNDTNLINNVLFLLQNKYTIVGDLNLKTNKQIAQRTRNFIGEDTLQTGIIGNNLIKKVLVLAAPSDHFLVIANVKCNVTINFPLRLLSISEETTYDYVRQICLGNVPAIKPKIKTLQYHVNLNDRERIINVMLNDYIANKLDKLYHRYKYVYFTGRKEPFLGINVNDNIIKTFAKHLHNNPKKKYVNVPYLPNTEFFDNKISVAKTKSKALTYDFMKLKDINEGVRIFLRSHNGRMVNGELTYFSIDDILNNVIKIANNMKNAIIANTFFLMKNKRLIDYNDVRTIIIMPSFIKIYESIIYNIIANYFRDFFTFKSNIIYQYGGIRGGSTYAAMLNLRETFINNNAVGVVLLDLKKGYDSVNMDILKRCIENCVHVEEIKSILMAWYTMILNLDYNMNNIRVRRERGIAMGLSLSPLIFEFYLDCALLKIDKKRITFYIDDGAIVLKADDTPEKNKEFVEEIKLALADFDLELNAKKTVIISKDANVKKIFSEFTIVDEIKYLGRLLMLNGDGKLVADDRLYNRKAFKSMACPYWVNFFTKRLIFNNGVISKLAYGLYMFSTSDISVRNATYRNAWTFLHTNFPKFSYLQVIFTIRNFIRFFIDSVDLKAWLDRKKAKEDPSIIDKEVISKIVVDLPQLKNAIEAIVPRWDVGDTPIFEKTKHFNDFLFESLKKNMIKQFKKEKKAKKIDVFAELEKFLNSKLFKHFGFMHNIVLLHIDLKKRSKIIAIILLIKSMQEELKIKLKNLEEANNGVKDSGEFCWDKIFAKIDTNINEDYKQIEDETWEKMITEKYKEMWSVISDILYVAEIANIKMTISKDNNDQEKQEKRNLAFYVDGAYNIKNNLIGYSVVIVNQIDQIEDIIKGQEYDDDEVTNSLKNIYGELRAAVTAVQWAVDHNRREIDLYYDYIGIQKYADIEWSTEVPFIQNYIFEMRKLRMEVKINFYKVVSHSGNKFNDIADKHAKISCGIDVGKSNNRNGKLKKFKKHSKEQIIYAKALYRSIFKTFVIIDVIYMNNNLNDLNVAEMIFNMRIKIANLEELSQKMFNIAEVDNDEDLTENLNDIMMEENDV